MDTCVKALSCGAAVDTRQATQRSEALVPTCFQASGCGTVADMQQLLHGAEAVVDTGATGSGVPGMHLAEGCGNAWSSQSCWRLGSRVSRKESPSACMLDTTGPALSPSSASKNAPDRAHTEDARGPEACLFRIHDGSFTRVSCTAAGTVPLVGDRKTESTGRMCTEVDIVGLGGLLWVEVKAVRGPLTMRDWAHSTGSNTRSLQTQVRGGLPSGRQQH
jgi:hypothetical protein